MRPAKGHQKQQVQQSAKPPMVAPQGWRRRAEQKAAHGGNRSHEHEAMLHIKFVAMWRHQPCRHAAHVERGGIDRQNLKKQPKADKQQSAVHCERQPPAVRQGEKAGLAAFRNDHGDGLHAGFRIRHARIMTARPPQGKPCVANRNAQPPRAPAGTAALQPGSARPTPASRGSTGSSSPAPSCGRSLRGSCTRIRSSPGWATSRRGSGAGSPAAACRLRRRASPVRS